MNKKVKLVGIFDYKDQERSGTVMSCYPCAKKHNLDLCGTPNAGLCICEYCGVQYIQP